MKLEDPEYRELGFDREANPGAFAVLCHNALAKQRVKYAVAPGQSVSFGGRIKNPYEEVTLNDFAGQTVDPEAAMRRLITMGLVLEKDGIQ